MPGFPHHTLTWTEDEGAYKLSVRGRAERFFRPGDAAAWCDWLGGATSFSFRGAAGSLNVYEEARPRGGR